MIGNREEKEEEGREDGKQEKEGRRGRKEKGKGHVQSNYENCIFPRHTWGECGTHGGNEFLEVPPGFACIVRHRKFL